MVGRVLSIWDGPFSRAMLNFGGVVGKEPLLMFCFDSMDDSELQKSSRNALGTDGILIVFFCILLRALILSFRNFTWH